MRIVPTILCGGAGSRLWPVSRELHPKPFIRMSDGQSLLQKTVLRGLALPYVDEILTITNRDLFFKVKDEFSELNHREVALSYILEPFVRNTAAAVAAAALQLENTHGGDVFMLVLPADHLIENQAVFVDAVEKAVLLAKAEKMVTFGVMPDYPETGFGYIEADKNEVVRFIEKPNFARAKEYVDSGDFLWNSGIFCFKVSALLKEMAQHCPDILSSVKSCLTESQTVSGNNTRQVELDSQLFEKVPDNSIDYALLEKSKQVAVVSGDFDWTDIGSWNALADLSAADANGNRIDGESLLHDVKNCYIRACDRLVGAVGISNLMIIDTPDALLVANKDSAQDVKKIYESLKSKKHEAYKLHRTVHRPWGNYTVLEEGERFKIKRIVVKPCASLSLQMHHHRSEHWIVVSGMAKVINGDRELYLRTNESTYIPAGHKHRLENPGKLELVMIEVQSGEYMGEDDIVRFEDIYGRVNKPLEEVVE